MRQVHPHVLRHTYASLLIRQGESLAYVRDEFGEASIQITVDTYGHLVPGGNHSAVDRRDQPAHPAATPGCWQSLRNRAKYLPSLAGARSSAG